MSGRALPYPLSIALLLAVATGCGGSGGGGEAAEGVGDRGIAATAEVAARVGDRTFTMEEVDEATRARSIQPFQQLYEARKETLEQMIAEHLLDTESAARGLSREELIALEVDQKISPATDDEIRSFYEARKAQISQSLSEVTPQIRNVITNSRRQERMSEFLKSLSGSRPIEIGMKPPRVPMTIAANDPYKGSPGAPVRIIEYSDFQ